MDFQELETERLKLVQISKQYTQSYFDIMSRDEVTKYYGMSSLKTIEDALKIIQTFQDGFENNKSIRWGMILKDSGVFIGTVGLNNLSTWSKKAEVGYELHPSHWHKGITTEAVKEVLRYSFEVLGLYRMGAITYPQNIASIQLLKQLGFTQEGLLRGYLYQNEQSHDAFVFSLLKTEWTEKLRLNQNL